MTYSLITACLWALCATVIAFAPRRFHWRGAWALIISGVPLIGWVTLDHGPLLGAFVPRGRDLCAALSGDAFVPQTAPRTR